jgi:hypothetical protein
MRVLPGHGRRVPETLSGRQPPSVPAVYRALIDVIDTVWLH